MKGNKSKELSAKRAWAMKRKQQMCDQRLGDSGVLSVKQRERKLLIRPELMSGVKVDWPDAPLNDEDA